MIIERDPTCANCGFTEVGGYNREDQLALYCSECPPKDGDKVYDITRVGDPGTKRGMLLDGLSRTGVLQFCWIAEPRPSRYDAELWIEVVW